MPTISGTHYLTEQASFLNRRFLNRFSGRACIIIGGGRSVADVEIDRLEGSHFIGVNASVYLSRFDSMRSAFVAGVILDRPYLDYILTHLNVDFAFPIFTGQTHFDNQCSLRNSRKRGIYVYGSSDSGKLGYDFTSFFSPINSGQAAVQLALLLGFDLIGLIGFDGSPNTSSANANFHHEYAKQATSEVLNRWSAKLDSYATELRHRNVAVMNFSDKSTLKAFPKVTVESWNNVITQRAAEVTC